VANVTFLEHPDIVLLAVFQDSINFMDIGLLRYVHRIQDTLIDRAGLVRAPEGFELAPMIRELAPILLDDEPISGMSSAVYPFNLNPALRYVYREQLV